MKACPPSPVSRRTAVTLFSRLRTAKGQSNPFPIYTDLGSLGPVFPAPWGGHLVTGFDLCDEVLRNRAWLEPDRSWRRRQGGGTRWDTPSSTEMGYTLLVLNPPDHTRMRRVFGSFDRTTIGRIGETVEGVTGRLLDSVTDRVHGGGEADLVDLVCEELPVCTIGAWLGLPDADLPRLRTLTHDQVFTQELLPSARQLALSDAATPELRAYFRNIVRERRARPGDDPISRWIATWDTTETDPDRSDEAVYFLTLSVFLAALETTSSLLSTTVRLLLEHPEWWDRLAAEPELAAGFVEETLRYDPPTPVVTRVAHEDMLLGGIEMRRDEVVHLMLATANRDPARHRDPHRFDPLRPPGHLAFGGGIHYCLGAPLARLEAQTVLRQLTQRLPRLALARRPTWAPRVAFRRLLNLDVAVA
ncbi:cytochrome P450 [Streptomyces qinzhouensis]|uniref:Cytochrome P450 n=1 Tax=Streptomyces qinzhouensis TaxID=2599401 RepID=A0A5B8JE57_9ACTN|nr:cytochrome P450 [Streptomyces qinzhouensis]QDY79686.1 cytochrome P450 [Streptomyces qinzhouensis]